MAPLLTGCAMVPTLVIFFDLLFHFNRDNLNKFDLYPIFLAKKLGMPNFLRSKTSFLRQFYVKKAYP